ncbi:MAG: BatD family protein [Lactobacillales bacterium]|jgi:hypothetical protein|nr:BatD family protein [Lactobacillales bacterium]
MKLFSFLLAAFFMCAAHGYTLKVEPNPVLMGESVRLSVISDRPFQNFPDISALENNFILAGQEERFFSEDPGGGKQTVVYEIVFHLFANKTGEVKISDIRIGDTVLDTVVLQVVEAKAGEEAQKIELASRLQSNEIYEGESVVYTARLVDAVGIAQGQITPPAADGVDITQIGRDRVFTKIDSGRRVRIFERDFLMTPQKTGAIQIIPPVFSGYPSVPRQKSVATIADLFDRGILFDGRTDHPVSASAQEMVLTVHPKPQNWNGWWLPSTDIVLKEELTLPDHLKVGEAIERKVMLYAKGLDVSKLPQIKQPGNGMIKIYPGSENRRTEIVGPGEIEGQLEISFAIIPTAGGQIKIPAITVPWFDTKTKTVKNAVLPEKEIVVADAVPVPVLVPGPLPVPVQAKSPDTSVSTIQNHARTSVFWIVGAVFLGVIIGVAAVLILGRLLARRRGKKHPVEKKKKKPLPDLYPF